MKIGDRLKLVLDERGMTAYELSKKTGISQAALSRILHNNTQKPNIENLNKISTCLGVHALWLLTGEGEKDIDDAAMGLALLDYYKRGGMEKDKLIELLEYKSNFNNMLAVYYEERFYEICVEILKVSPDHPNKEIYENTIKHHKTISKAIKDDLPVMPDPPHKNSDNPQTPPSKPK